MFTSFPKCLPLVSRITSLFVCWVSGRCAIVCITILSPFANEIFLQPMEDSPQLRAVSGIAYYMSPPHTMKEAFLDPIHTIVYVLFMLSACALFSKAWIEISGSGPRDVAKQLKDQQMVCYHPSWLILSRIQTFLFSRLWPDIVKVRCTKNWSASFLLPPRSVVPFLVFCLSLLISWVLSEVVLVFWWLWLSSTAVGSLSFSLSCSSADGLV